MPSFSRLSVCVHFLCIVEVLRAFDASFSPCCFLRLELFFFFQILATPRDPPDASSCNWFRFFGSAVEVCTHFKTTHPTILSPRYGSGMGTLQYGHFLGPLQSSECPSRTRSRLYVRPHFLVHAWRILFSEVSAPGASAAVILAPAAHD